MPEITSAELPSGIPEVAEKTIPHLRICEVSAEMRNGLPEGNYVPYRVEDMRLDAKWSELMREGYAFIKA